MAVKSNLVNAVAWMLAIAEWLSGFALRVATKQGYFQKLGLDQSPRFFLFWHPSPRATFSKRQFLSEPLNTQLKRQKLSKTGSKPILLALPRPCPL